MFIDLLFLSKSDKLELETLKSDLSEKLYFEEKTLFCNEKPFHYKFYTARNKKNIKMRISTLKGGSTKIEAEELELLKFQIMKGKHRSNYYIVSIYDGAAEYYCNKLYRFISVFERKLRQLIYLTVIMAYGNEWIDKTFNEELKNCVSKEEHNKNAHIEMALECFTFQNYLDYLFTKKTFCNTREEIHNIIHECSMPNPSIKIIKESSLKLKEESLWSKLFEKTNIKFSEENIDEIRKIRNHVLHNRDREISSTYFDSNKKLLRNSISKMEDAINKLEAKQYFDSESTYNVLYSLGKSISTLSDIIEGTIKYAMPSINVIGSVIKKALEDTKKYELESSLKSVMPIFTNTTCSALQELKISLGTITQNLSPALQSLESSNTFEAPQTWHLQNISATIKNPITQNLSEFSKCQNVLHPSIIESFRNSKRCFETDFTSLIMHNSNIRDLSSRFSNCSEFHFTNSKINKYMLK